VVEEARKHLHVAAVATSVQALLIGTAVGFLLWRSWIIGAVAGGLAALAIALLVSDWARKLDHRPRGFNLVRARDGALLVYAMLPAGPWLAPRIRRPLNNPVLAKYAVSNHPEAGEFPSEVVLRRIRARGAFISLRRTAFAYLVIGGVLVFGADDLPFGVIFLVGTVFQLVAGIAGTLAMGRLPERRSLAVWMSVLAMPWLPFGPVCFLAVRSAFAKLPTRWKPPA
jgi:hypothetical protein